MNAQIREGGFNLEKVYKKGNIKEEEVDEQKQKRAGGDNIQFKGKPNFKRPKNVGNKMEFPELDDEPKSDTKTKTAAEIGGPTNIKKPKEVREIIIREPKETKEAKEAKEAEEEEK